MLNRRLLPLLSCALMGATTGLAASSAMADEFYGGDRALAFEGTRTRAEVAREANGIPAKRNLEPAGSRVYSLGTYAPGQAQAQASSGGSAAMSRSAVRGDYLQDRMKTAALYGEDSGSFELGRRGWGSLAVPSPRQ